MHGLYVSVNVCAEEFKFHPNRNGMKFSVVKLGQFEPIMGYLFLTRSLARSFSESFSLQLMDT